MEGCLTAMKLPTHPGYLCLTGMWDARQCGASAEEMSTGLEVGSAGRAPA